MIVSQIIFSDEITQNIKNKKTEDDIIKVRYRKDQERIILYIIFEQNQGQTDLLINTTMYQEAFLISD